MIPFLLLVVIIMTLVVPLVPNLVGFFQVISLVIGAYLALKNVDMEESYKAVFIGTGIAWGVDAFSKNISTFLPTPIALAIISSFGVIESFMVGIAIFAGLKFLYEVVIK